MTDVTPAYEGRWREYEEHLKAVIRRLTAALVRYGQHETGCTQTSAKTWMEPCDCGLNTIEAEFGEGPLAEIEGESE